MKPTKEGRGACRVGAGRRCPEPTQDESDHRHDEAYHVCVAGHGSFPPRLQSLEQIRIAWNHLGRSHDSVTLLYSKDLDRIHAISRGHDVSALNHDTLYGKKRAAGGSDPGRWGGDFPRPAKPPAAHQLCVTLGKFTLGRMNRGSSERYYLRLIGPGKFDGSPSFLPNWS